MQSFNKSIETNNIQRGQNITSTTNLFPIISNLEKSFIRNQYAYTSKACPLIPPAGLPTGRHARKQKSMR